MKRISLSLIIGLLILGCATAKRSDILFMAEEHSIDCSGEMNSWDECYRDANEICDERGYRVLSRSNDGGQVARRERGWFDSSESVRRLKIRCAQ